jgi:hypothetical protein
MDTRRDDLWKRMEKSFGKNAKAAFQDQYLITDRGGYEN